MRRFGQFVLLAGCQAPSHPAPLPQPPPVVAAEVPIGLSDFTAAPAAARIANDRGVALLRAGKLDEAKAAFAQSLASAPSFVLGRYDLACAKARAGEHAAALQDLEAAFELDFVGLRAFAAQDPDLTTFWTSPQGAALTAKLPAYAARYAAVIARGLHAILWRDAPDSKLFGHRSRPALLRVGVYDPGTQRFVPVAPRAAAITAYAPTTVPYAVVITGAVSPMLGGDNDSGHRLDSVQAFPYDASGVPLGTLALDGARANDADLWLGAQDLRIVLRDAADPPLVQWSLKFGSAPTKKLAGDRAQLADPKDRTVWPVRLDAGHNHWGSLLVDEVSSTRALYAKGTVTLPDGKRIEIPKSLRGPGVPTLLPAPNDDRLLVLWSKADVRECDGEPIPGKYKLVLVTPSTGEVRSLGAGVGAGFARFDASGVIHVQKDRRVLRVDADGTQTPLPDGVLLVPPQERDNQCGF